MLEDGVIEESISPWRAQFLIVSKERHRKRLVADYSLSSNIFIRPLQNIDDHIHEFSQLRHYSSLNLPVWVYYQINNWSEERPCTIFEINDMFCKIQIGVTNWEVCFQMYIDNIRKHNLLLTYAYLDNILITEPSPQQQSQFFFF